MKIAITASFTSEPIMTPLRSWLQWLNEPHEIVFAPYNQVLQQFLDPRSALAQNESGINVVILRLSDWSVGDVCVETLRDRAEEFIGAVESFSRISKLPLFILLCAHDSSGVSTEACKIYRSIENFLKISLAPLPQVHFFRSSEIDRCYPVSIKYDASADRTGHIPYTNDYFVALATVICRRLVRLQQPIVKAVVLDCDQTLWDGVCGEVGSQGVRITEQRREFQSFLLGLREAGILLCLCSKNNPEDAWAVFHENRSMLLRPEHITAAEFNWNDKSDSLSMLARRLKLGLNSFVFIDDNPLEIAEVRARCPEVLALQLPARDFVSFTQNVWALDILRLTEDDLHRANRYSDEVSREQLREQSQSFHDFIDSLDLQVNFKALNPEYIERAVQLTQRTNQFNFNKNPLTVSQLQQVCADRDYRCFLVDAKDRFGDYGIVGCFIYNIQTDRLVVDTFLLSCRAMGRNLEYRMLHEIAVKAAEASVSGIDFAFAENDKNVPAANFLDRTFGNRLSSDGVKSYYRVSVHELPKLLDASLHAIADSEQERVRTFEPTSSVAPDSALFNDIAENLATVDRIIARIKKSANPRPVLADAFVPPQSALEKRIAEICADVLNLQEVGVYDGLKELGASSVQLVQILSRLESDFSSGLSITDMFAARTVEDIVRRVATTQDSQTVLQKKSVHAVSKNSLINNQASRGIAIIGMAGRFPGAENVSQFWHNLTHGICSIVEIPEDQLNLPADSPLRKNANLVRKSAAVKDADKFDAKFFGIFPKEAIAMDPQHRLLLENCWHAVEDAGYNVDSIDIPVGVFAGCYMDTYILSSLATSPKWLESLANAFHGGDLQTELGNDKDYLATRVSFHLNLRGPSITIQTACSTSLVAISQACQSLVAHQCDMALAGGSTLKLPQNRGYLYTDGGMVSPDGVCRTFDAQARGTVFGEGSAVVLLKRVEDAVADGDDIYAVIKGWGLNNDGRAKVGFTAPSVEGQSTAIEIAHRAASITADTITMMEAHGTGTALGDPIEIESLTKTFRKTTDKTQYCAIGSLKTNIGHLDVAAGVTGLIKVGLSLRNKVIPPSLNFSKPNPNINFDASPFYVNTELRKWESASPRRAGLSSFGVGGTNAHVVVEEAPEHRLSDSLSTTTTKLLVVSARSDDALDQACKNILEYFTQHPDCNLDDVAYTLQVGRKTFASSFIAAVRDVNDAINVLENKPAERCYSNRQLRRGKSVVFMFPGQGSQHPDMVRDLYERDPSFADHMNQCGNILEPLLGSDLRKTIYREHGADSAGEEINQTIVAQSSIFAISYSLAKALYDYGIQPKRMVGHSVGEFVAACLAGVFSLEDALRLIVFRSQQMQKLPSGTMLAVRLDEHTLRTNLPNELSMAAVNGPALCVVSGPTEIVDRFQLQLEKDDVVCRRLHTSHAFHSAMMDPAVEPFAQVLREVKLNPPRVPIVSTVTGIELTDQQACDPWYWASHLRETVRFTDAVQRLCESEEDVLLEVGPGQTLSVLTRQHPARSLNQTVLSTCPHARQRVSSEEFWCLTLGRLWQRGVDVNWKSKYRVQRRNRVHLPGYPFERQRYWFDEDAASDAGDPLAAESLSQTSATAKTNASFAEHPGFRLSGASESVAAIETSELTFSADEGPTECEVKSVNSDNPVGTSCDKSSSKEVDALTRRIIEQQLWLMKQQLEVWNR